MKQECRILVVDDDLSFRKLVEKEFKPLGFTIHLAEDGEKALEALESFRPHIVILDLLLPKIDGFEVGRRIRETPGFESVHILMVTAVYMDEEDIRRGIKQGANGYYFKPDLILTKPVHIKELRDAVVFMCKEVKEPKEQGQKLRDTILVIDDDEKNRKLLKMRLQSEDYIVKEAADGLEGLKAIDEQVPELIVCDVKMPGMSGLDLVKEIREKEIDIPIIVMTAYGSESIAVDAFKRGADDYFIKPFDTQNATKRVSHLIEKYALKKSNERLVERLKEISIELIERLNTMETQNRRLEEAYIRHKELSDFNQEFIRSEATRIQNSLEEMLLQMARGASQAGDKGPVDAKLLSHMVSLSNMARLTAIQSRLCHPNPKKFALGSELESILEVWKKALAACGITIEDRSAGESALIQGDRVFFGELIKNILENCRSRMKEGGGIVIDTALTRAQTDTLSFRIEDSGRNLDAEELAKLDLDSLGTRAYRKGGEALRLSLCRYLSECLDWDFAVSNIEGGGARFTLDIPLSGGK
ncbi:MAG TPA: response regulator [Acidobacteriota bacterium]|nr:response regulator [Acidobacteriota bacterium]HNT16873.1 response regulator [Acidobacteriota bacterium]